MAAEPVDFSLIQRTSDGRWMRVDTGDVYRTWTAAYIKLKNESKPK